jgi:pyruvate/2-oxoglutarate dehydrogenase complex dihydrolipoamide dehydrogenase (E3) component
MNRTTAGSAHNQRDLVIIGGGVSGLVIASIAGQLGLNISLIEKSARLGGDCLHYGCVPSKTLIHTAKLASSMRQAARFGLPAFDPQVDIAQVNARIHSVIEQIQAHDDPERFRGYGVDVRLGKGAHFIEAQQVETGGSIIQGKRFVIATGSRPLMPEVPGLEDSGFVTNENMYSLERLPTKLVVLGAGPVGLEMAQAFRRLGSRVTLIEAQSHILPNEDDDVSSILTEILRADGIAIYTGITAERISCEQNRKTVHCSKGLSFDCDALLVAVGRRPNVDDLGLESAGVDYTPKGIKVDRHMRTSKAHIYACGDVTGVMPFTHVAEYQAGIVIGNALFRFPKKAAYSAVPWVIFTDPELARVGKNKTQADAEGLKVETVCFEFQNIDRAKIEGSTLGLAKLTLHKGRIIGASILGPHAGELIHELALAVAKGCTPGDISGVVHAYPTLAEINRRAANAYLSSRLFSNTSKRLVGLLNRWLA